ncbi:hypothetical protein DENSPDRAFT_855138 [Dentipellis sp. KUC8613]|nr:hypothetical protein DENSPDRAFT_855138 [Dentipellis sp. KUC8613]
MSSSFETDIAGSLGAVLLGGWGSIALSGMVFLQSLLYFRLYQSDRLSVKVMVGWLWALDAAQVCVVCSSLWSNLIVHFGDRSRGDFIPTTLALTLFFTCLASFTVHCYYAHMIYRLTGNNWWIAVPVVVLALLRVRESVRFFSNVASDADGDLPQLSASWAITLGYAISATLDVIVATALCWKLQSSRKRGSFSDTNRLIDTFTSYTINNGLLTCAAAIVSMICWFTVKGTLVFLGTHFLIGKFYTLSVLTSLNMRRLIRSKYKKGIMSSRPQPVQIRGTCDPGCQTPGSGDMMIRQTFHGEDEMPVHITVEKTIQYDPEVTGATATIVDINGDSDLPKLEV